MADTDNKISIAKVFTIDFVSMLAACVFGAGVSWATITSSDSNQDKKIDDNLIRIENVSESQRREFEVVKKEIKDIQIQNAAMQNEQVNQSRNIEQIVRVLERIEGRLK